MARAAGVNTDAARIGSVLPEYVVERELGRGGMGVVYLGRHRRLERGVAIKELPSSFAVDPAVRERFSTEAQTLAGLSHPHIVPIFDYVERDGLCLIVMEELPGGSVWDRFTTAGLTPPTACAVVIACCAALNYAHGKGVLHLDVKPDNLMFDAESAVKVTDFGISRVITGDRTMGTVDGQVLGTPAYMSPEQARGDALTPSSDVYAAGVMLYELLSGALPWLGAETASELLQQRLNEDPVPLRIAAAHVPEPVEAVVMAALSRDVEVRYQGAEDLGVAIGAACVASWGPDWLDHSGLAIFGSERLSRASRTTGAFTMTAGTPARPSGVQERVTTGDLHANEASTSGARGTVTSGRHDTVTSGAHETTTSGAQKPAVSGAHETTTSGAQKPAVSGAHETTVSGAQKPAVSGAHDTTVSGAQRPAISGARETAVTGGQPATPGAHETVSGAEPPAVPGAHETTASGATRSPVPGAKETAVTGGPTASASGAKETTASGQQSPPGAAPGTATSEPQAPASDATGPTGRAALPGLTPTAPKPLPGLPPTPPGAAGDAMFQVVKAAAGGDSRIEGIDLYRLEVADLIGVEDVLDPPRPPWTAVAWASGLLAVAIVVALIGLGGSGDDGGGLEPGQVMVDGQDVVDGGRIELDLSRPIAVQIDDPRLASRADEVELSFGYGDMTLSGASGAVRDGESLVDPGLAQRLAGGELNGTLTVRTHGRTLASQGFGVETTQTWYLTVPFIGSVLLLLLGYANLESSLKPLRSGRVRRLSYIGAFFAGLPLAAGIVLFLGAVGVREPTLPSLSVVAALCMAAGIPAVRARIGVARTRRVRQAVRRAERSMGVSSGPTGRFTGRSTGRGTGRSTGGTPAG